MLAGGRGSRLGMLTDWRTKPAVPFGGKFRIVDFTLSNCLNSGIRRICVLTQYKSHSLIQHLIQGWGSLQAERGEFIDIIPAQQWLDHEEWYQGTADAVYQSLDIIQGYGPEHVLILAGDHIYAMDYGEILATHASSGADFTIACYPVPKKDASEFGIMSVDENMRLVEFAEKPQDPQPMPDDPDMCLASMGIYVASMKYLSEQLRRDAKDKSSSHDFGKDLIPYALADGHHLHAYPFRNAPGGGPSYWRDVGTIDAYYDATLEVLSPDPPLDVYDQAWPIRTYQPQLPAARFVGAGRRCRVEDTIVAGGCIVDKSELDHTLLYSNVRVGEDCDLQGVLALPDSEVGAGSRLKRVILDNGCIVPPGTVIGENHRSDRERFHITDNGVVVVNRTMLGQEDNYVPTYATQL